MGPGGGGGDLIIYPERKIFQLPLRIILADRDGNLDLQGSAT